MIPRGLTDRHFRQAAAHLDGEDVPAERQALWDDPGLLESFAKTEDEHRYLLIGLINGKHRSAIFTYRNASVRLISVRRTRPEEVA